MGSFVGGAMCATAREESADLASYTEKPGNTTYARVRVRTESMEADRNSARAAAGEQYGVLLTTQELSVLAVATGLIELSAGGDLSDASDARAPGANLGRAELAEEVRARLQEAVGRAGALNAVEFTGEQWLFAIATLAMFAEFLGQYADGLREGGEADEALERYFPGINGDPFRVELIADRARLVQLRLEQKQR